jgi:hypothetical protein
LLRAVLGPICIALIEVSSDAAPPARCLPQAGVVTV